MEGKTVPEREQQAAAALGAAKSQLEILRAGSRAQEIEVAKQQLAAAEADYDLSQKDYNRFNELYSQGVVSRQQRDFQQSRLDTAKARVLAASSALSLAVEGPRSEDIRAAEERVRQAEAALREAKAGQLQIASRRKAAALALEQKRQAEAAARAARAALAETVIRAPFDGVVAERFVDAGDMAIPGAPLLEMFGGEIRLVVSGPEDTLKVLRKGSTVQWALRGQGKLEGARVAEVLPAADPTAHTVVVKLSLPKRVPPGLSGEAEVVLGRRKAVTLPKEAVARRDGVEYVFIASDNGTAELRIIQTTSISTNLLEALSGLNSGERIVINPPPSLTDGMRLKLKKESQ
jgi:HlyD family secretion protein